MPFSPVLDDPISRVRFGVGDISATPLFADAIYTALLAAADNDEAAATRSAAAALAAYYATQPSTLAADGTTLTWGQRISQWNAIAQGTAGGSIPAAEPTTPAPPSGATCHAVEW